MLHELSALTGQPASVLEASLFYFGFCLCGLPQTHPCTTAIFFDELDAGRFESPTNYSKCGPSRIVAVRFQLTDRHNSHTGAIGQYLLAPI